MTRNKKTLFKIEYKIITVSILFGIVFWVLDAFLDYLFFYKGTFWEILITEINLHELYIRTFALVLFILFGLVFINVIKKKEHIEENLRKSEERFKTLFDGVPVGLYRTKPNGEIINANDAMVEILGYPDRESLLKVNAVNLYVYPDERERILKKENETGVIIDVEVQLRKYDSSHIWVQYSSKALKDENGNIRFYEGSLRDITERKKTEEALHESEEKFRVIFEDSNDAIMLLTEKGFFDCNPRTLEIFGLKSKEEFTRSHPSTLSPPNQPDGQPSLEASLERIKTAFEQGSNRFEWMHRRANGEDFPAEVLLTAIDYEGNSVLQATVRDITERKRTEEINSVLYQISEATNISSNLDELLKTIEKHLSKLIDTTNFYIALYNENTGMYSFPFFVDEFEKPEDFKPQPLRKSLTDYVRRTGRPLLADEKVLEQLTKKGAVDIVGVPSLIWMGAPLKSTRGIFGVVVVQSYSDSFLYTEKDLDLLTFVSGNIALAIERKNAEEQIKKSRVQLQNLSHKLQQIREDEKEKIAYGIYEDSSQILAVLMMDISWLQKNIPKDNEKLFEKLNSMKSLADKGNKDMLRVKEELRSSQLDFIGLDAAIQWYLEELQKRSGIKFKFTYKISDIELSKNFLIMLYRVFEELMKNVEEHSKAMNVNIDIEFKDSILEMKIKDDGIGISNDKIDDSKSIGIIGIKERMRPYNGEVIFEGDHNKGTTVTVRIPLEKITDESGKLMLFDDI